MEGSAGHVDNIPEYAVVNKPDKNTTFVVKVW